MESTDRRNVTCHLAVVAVIALVGVTPLANAKDGEDAAREVFEALLEATDDDDTSDKKAGTDTRDEKQNKAKDNDQSNQSQESANSSSQSQQKTKQQADTAGGKFDRDNPQSHWAGRYVGSGDGRNATLELKSTGKVSSDTMAYAVTWRDKDRDAVFQGTGYVDFAKDKGRAAHVMYFTRQLAGPDGKKKVERLYLHTWDTDVISGTTKWRGTSYGVAFNAKWALSDNNGSKLDRGNPSADWGGDYSGSHDGRNASLSIKPLSRVDANTMSYTVRLRDEERGTVYQGQGYVDLRRKQGRPAHMMYFPRALAGPDGETEVEAIYLHTWGTNFISGTTQWQGTSYGMAFKAE